MPIRAVPPLNYKQAALNSGAQNHAQNGKRENTPFARFLSEQPATNQNTAHPRNLQRLEQLHDKIAILRGEILANALNGKTANLSELDAHLTTLNKTLKAETARLSGTLLDLET